MVKVKKIPPVRAPKVVREEEEEREPEEKRESRRRDSSKPKYMLWLVAGVSLIFFLLALSYLFLKVTVKINPKTVNLVLNESLSASLDGAGESLVFDLVVIGGEEIKTVRASEEKEVSEKAKGVAVIYNNFGPDGQRLDIDTRLEGSNGKIYKTEKQVIVPGIKGSTPGSVEVGIYAAEGGEKSNSGPLDFTIVGFKGTPKYSKFYARSKGDIAGGFTGKAPVVSDAEKETALNEAKASLKQKLFKKAKDQIPDGFVLFKDAGFLRLDEENISPSAASGGSLAVKGTFYGFLFDEKALTKKIAEKNIPKYDGADIYLQNIGDLNFSLSDEQSSALAAIQNIAEVKKIDFNLKGSAKIIFKLDEGKFKTDLLGQSKRDFDKILAGYPNIDSADLTVSPFWKMSFPDKIKNIKVIVNYPK